MALSIPISAAPSIDNRIDTRISEAAERGDGRIPVVIRYKEGYTHEDAVSANGIYMAMGSGFEKRREYAEMNAVSGRISKAALYALKKNPNVEFVEYDAVFQISLQDVLPLVSANRAHNATAGGAQVNGFGETVCVLDTGINYTHPDLGGCNATTDINNGSCAKVVGGYNYCVDDNCNTENSNPLDNHGHGTHVSGIIAANGTLRGIAPGARIAAMKVCNSTGSCFSSDIGAAIRWCTNNATRLNISVISMSLGGGLFQNACDNDDVSLTDAVNNATRFNISVLAAAGNDGNSTAIISPACITNVTAIASSTKADGISSFTNRNALVQIIAPGSSINSTDFGGGYSIKSGTSMATPAAAGAFALVRAYERLESRTNMTPASIRNALNSTGTSIFDSASNRSYSRINALAAISSIDNTLPNLSISSPANTTFSTANMTLNVTVHDNVLVDRCWYFNATGANNSLVSCQNITFLGIEGQNNITVYVNDSNGNTNSSQRFFRIDTIAPAIATQSPANTTFATNNITLNFTASDAAISTCLYSLNSGANVTIMNCSNITFLAAAGENNLTVYANDTASNINSTTVRFTINISAPILAIQSPLNRTYATAPTFNFTAVDNNIERCWYSPNGGANTSLANCTNLSSVGSEGFNRLTLYAN
ncbi:MAG: S8 family serine peptidase, partial [Candidatus Aenigmarchaeota archaeon]|nr:S8 family serine peptidase [Candidatus Aenigmarchaeota archaeon]